MRTTPLLGALCVTALTLLSPATQAADTKVVTSIKPLELLVRAIATDATQITSLVPAGASPHTYQMRPSQRQALESADLVFWVGEDMETFLTRLLSSDDFRTRSVALMPHTDHDHEHGGEHNMDLEEHDMVHEETHEGHHEAHEEHKDDAHGHEEESHQDDGHDHNHDHGDGEDPHVWLDPQQALAMTHEIHGRLVALPGADTGQLNANLARFEQQLHDAEHEIRHRLEAAREVSLFTYHDAFRRFAEHYGLDIAGVLTLNPERSPGARHVAEVQQQLQASSQPCLLTEPQFNRQWWRSITEGMDLRFSTWDPLASDIEVSADGYVKFQYELAEAVLACLPE